jgi:hypothetical protein
VGALADGASYQVSVSAQDSAGNSASATHGISGLARLRAGRSVYRQRLLRFQRVQHVVTRQCRNALVGSDGTWTLDVPAADLAILSQGALTVTASVND